MNRAAPQDVDRVDRSRPAPRRSRFWRLTCPSWSERKRLLRREAWVALGAGYGIVIFAWLWPQDFRNAGPAYVATAWTAFMVRTFLFHLGLLVLVVAAIAALARYWRMAGAALPLVLFTTGPTLWQYRPRPERIIAGEPLTVMSVNLLMVNRNTGSMIDEIRAASPDVLLFQEYTAHWHDALQAAFRDEYPHVACERREDSFGAAIYSRRPFLEPVRLDVPLGQATEPQMRAVIAVQHRPVALYNVHLLPPWGLEYVIETRDQFADLIDVLAVEPHPVVLAGDFNFTEASPQAFALKRLGLRSAHNLGGRGRGVTWPVNSFFRWVPGIRLDHVFLAGDLTCTTCRTGVGAGSDHRPVIAELGFLSGEH